MTGRPTPKNARAPHKRKARPISSIATPDRYRLEGSWNDRPDRPATTTTSDRKKARALARKWAAAGAYVIVQENTGWHVWRTLEEFDGPALLAERHAEQALAAAGYPPVPPGYEPDAADRTRTWLAHMDARAIEAEERATAAAAEQQRRHRIATEAARSSRTLMAAPDHARRDPDRARHTTGGRR